MLYIACYVDRKYTLNSSAVWVCEYIVFDFCWLYHFFHVKNM